MPDLPDLDLALASFFFLAVSLRDFVLAALACRVNVVVRDVDLWDVVET